MEMRGKFEDAFEAWTHAVQRHRWWVVAIAVLVSLLAASQLPKLELETSTESYLIEEDQARTAYDALREQFGRDQVMLIALEPLEVFDLDFLAYLRELHEALEERLPHLERVTSLINVRSVEGRGDRLIVGDLLEEFPANEVEMAALRKRVLSTPSYIDRIISADGSITTIVVESDAYSSIGRAPQDTLSVIEGFDDGEPSPGDAGEATPPEFLTAAEIAEFVEAGKQIAREFERPGIRTYIAGSTMLSHEVGAAMQREMPGFFATSLLVIALVLMALFRRVLPCVVSLGVVVLSVLASFGCSAVLGAPVSILSQILPSFLLAVGVGYAVHLFAIYYQRLDAGVPSQAALVHAMRHSGPPILMTALTTATGLASFLVALMPPMRDFGYAALLGVAWTLVLNLSLLPAIISILPAKPAAETGSRPEKPNRLLLWVGMTAARNPWKVVTAAALLAVSSVVSSTAISVSNNPIKYLAHDNPFRVAFEKLDERLGYSMSIELFVDTGEENGLYRPEVMNRLDAIGDYVAAFELDELRLGRTNSVVDIAKETHQALNANDPAFYAIPQERELLAQELLLFENSGSDDLERVVDPQFRLARYSILSRFKDGRDFARISRKLVTELPRVLGPEIEVAVTGTSMLIGRMIETTTQSLFRTYALAFAVITPLMMLLIGSLRAGLVSMAPNLLPIMLTIGLMPLLGRPLDVFTMMLGCIAIGLAVDDTLHFIHGFRARYARSGDPMDAIEQTLHTTGRALLYTSVVLISGFLVLTMSSMSNLQALGGLTAFAIGAAFLLDIIVTPALLVLVTPKRAGG